MKARIFNCRVIFSSRLEVFVYCQWKNHVRGPLQRELIRKCFLTIFATPQNCSIYKFTENINTTSFDVHFFMKIKHEIVWCTFFIKIKIRNRLMYIFSVSWKLAAVELLAPQTCHVLSRAFRMLPEFPHKLSTVHTPFHGGNDHGTHPHPQKYKRYKLIYVHTDVEERNTQPWVSLYMADGVPRQPLWLKRHKQSYRLHIFPSAVHQIAATWARNL